MSRSALRGRGRADVQLDALIFTALECIIYALVIAFSDHLDLRIPNISRTPAGSASVSLHMNTTGREDGGPAVCRRFKPQSPRTGAHARAV